MLNADPKTIVTEEGEKKEIKPLNILPLNANEKGTDENCIVYDNNSNRFIVATTKGYTTYDPATLNEIETVENLVKQSMLLLETVRLLHWYSQNKHNTIHPRTLQKQPRNGLMLRLK